MDSPVYKLESVVRTKTEELEDFEGPLDLILYLLSKDKIEIQDIPIARILDQYLAYLDRRQEMDLEVASEFVAMAAQLMYIKTRMLLSIEDEETQAEMEQLVRALEERRSSEAYQRIKGVLGEMGRLSAFGLEIFTRAPEPLERGRAVVYHHEPADLLRAMAALSSRAERRAPPRLDNFQGIVQREPYPVADKAAELLARLGRGRIVRFLGLFFGCQSRSEVVATFLAVLEMCKAKLLHISDGEDGCTVTALEDSGQEAASF